MSDIAKAAKVSRQAVYLHFDTRAELLIATTRHMDSQFGVDQRLVPSREAETGVERIEAFVRFWGEYLPNIAGVARALIAMRDTDPDARAAWDERMEAVRDGCAAAIRDLARDGQLAEYWDEDVATDLFWSMLSFHVWDRLTRKAGWSTEDYIDRITAQAILTLVGR